MVHLFHGLWILFPQLGQLALEVESGWHAYLSSLNEPLKALNRLDDIVRVSRRHSQNSLIAYFFISHNFKSTALTDLFKLLNIHSSIIITMAEDHSVSRIPRFEDRAVIFSPAAANQMHLVTQLA
jgi:hypothetical protein